MSKKDFASLVELIEHDDIFYNNSNVPQAPVAWQLLVTMSNFGLAGNGGQCPIKAKLFSMAGKENFILHHLQKKFYLTLSVIE